MLTSISLFGSLQALLLGLATMVRVGRGENAARGRLRRRVQGVLMVVFGAAVAVIALDHSGGLPAAAPLEWIEYALSLGRPGGKGDPSVTSRGRIAAMHRNRELALRCLAEGRPRRRRLAPRPESV